MVLYPLVLSSIPAGPTIKNSVAFLAMEFFILVEGIENSHKAACGGFGVSGVAEASRDTSL